MPFAATRPLRYHSGVTRPIFTVSQPLKIARPAATACIVNEEPQQRPKHHHHIKHHSGTAGPCGSESDTKPPFCPRRRQPALVRVVGHAGFDSHFVEVAVVFEGGGRNLLDLVLLQSPGDSGRWLVIDRETRDWLLSAREAVVRGSRDEWERRDVPHIRC